MKININKQLFDELNNYLKKTSFVQVDDLVEYIIEQYLAQDENQINNLDTSDGSQDQLNKRLKDLGYL